MTLQEQVCTREQATRLKELGCKQGESLFSYWKDFDEPVYKNNARPYYGIAAYTVAELGEMLAALDEDIRMPTVIHGTWRHYSFWHGRQPFTTEAQARAALLIHILEKEKEQ